MCRQARLGGRPSPAPSSVPPVTDAAGTAGPFYPEYISGHRQSRARRSPPRLDRRRPESGLPRGPGPSRHDDYITTQIIFYRVVYAIAFNHSLSRSGPGRSRAARGPPAVDRTGRPAFVAPTRSMKPPRGDAQRASGRRAGRNAGRGGAFFRRRGTGSRVNDGCETWAGGTAARGTPSDIQTGGRRGRAVPRWRASGIKPGTYVGFSAGVGQVADGVRHAGCDSLAWPKNIAIKRRLGVRRNSGAARTALEGRPPADSK